MKLVHPFLDTIINLDNEEKVNILVVENQKFFSELLTELSNQLSKTEGRFVLSRDNTPIPLYDNIELISEFIPFDINRKNLINKLLKRAEETAQKEDFILATRELNSFISNYAQSIADDIGYDIYFSFECDILSLLKAIDFKFRDDYISVSEKIIEYMLLVNEFEREKCYVLVNFRDYICDSEIDEFYKTILYNKLKVLIISAKDYPKSVYEIKTIIDKDLCEF